APVFILYDVDRNHAGRPIFERKRFGFCSIGCGTRIIPLVIHGLMAARKQRQEEHSADKNIHPDRVQIAHPPSGNIFSRQKSRPQEQIPYRYEELAVEMSEVFKEMTDQMTDAFRRFKVLLAA